MAALEARGSAIGGSQGALVTAKGGACGCHRRNLEHRMARHEGVE